MRLGWSRGFVYARGMGPHLATAPWASLCDSLPGDTFIFSPEFFCSELAAKLGLDLSAADAQQTLAEYGRDWTREHTPNPAVLARPRSSDEVAQILAFCHAHNICVVPSGGRTGLAGGAVARAGELVLSLERMTRMDPVDEVGQTVRVEAGAITAAVHAHCESVGLSWPVDFAASGSSQIGGNLATNAGGIRVVRYGLTRQWVLGLEVVTMEGEHLSLGGALEKNNTGIDLRQLFIGSEGTLGIVVAATLKLAPMPGASQVALLAVEDVGAALKLLGHVRKSAGLGRGFELLGFEYMTAACLRLSLKDQGQAPISPDISDAYVLIEFEVAQAQGQSDGDDPLSLWLAHVFEEGMALDGVLAQSEREARALWRLREDLGESLAKAGFLHKNDISVPIAALAAFLPQMRDVFAAHHPQIPLYVFGHLGDGNLHINAMQPKSMEKADFLALCQDMDNKLFACVAAHKGSISAEHGIGLLKKPYLHWSRSQAELGIMAKIKAALDPKGLLNPGKVLDVQDDG